MRTSLTPLLLLPLLLAATAPPDPLLSSLDLTRPDLAAVKQAYDRGDLPAARHAFADHLRTRTTVHWQPTATDALVDPAKKRRTTADDAIAHKFTVVNVPYAFPGPIDWTYNPTAAPGSKNAVNHEWTWQFNRHTWWPALAAAYRSTHDRRYADELCHEITDWVARNPPPADKAANGPYSRWRTIEAGIRMAGPWPQTLFTLLPDQDAFPDDVLLAMVESMRQHADYLDRLSPLAHSNWTVMESNGLFHVATLFPEFEDSARWRDTAVKRQLDELRAQVYPDGAQIELTPGYHNVSLTNFLGTLQLARLNDIPLPDDYASLMERMFDVDARLSLPDRTYPNFNDSGRGGPARILEQGLAFFPSHADWRWLVTNGREGSPPTYTSTLLPYAGIAVMRSDWSRDAVALALDAGPYGAAHQHEDKLNFILDAYGAHLVAECGIFTYDKSDMRKYSLGPRAHNLLFVDGLAQNRRAGPPQRTAAKAPLTWSTSPDFDYAAASFGPAPDERWGPNRLTGFTHTRHILFVKPDRYFVVIDTVTPPPGDTAEHTYESIFHLDAPAATIDPATNAVTTANPKDKPNLSILPLNSPALSVHIVQGQTTPDYQGWVSDNVYDRRAVPTPGFTLKTKGPATLLYVFAPSAPDQSPPITSVAASPQPNKTLSATLTSHDGTSARVTLDQHGTLHFTAGGGKTFDAPPTGR